MTDKRIEPRFLCSSLVKLTRLDGHREQESQFVNLDDISPSGACISSDKPISLHATVLLEYAEGQLPGTVRYSIYYGGGYVTGIEFSFGCKWFAECFQPEHLTNLKQIGAKHSE